MSQGWTEPQREEDLAEAAQPDARHLCVCLCVCLNLLLECNRRTPNTAVPLATPMEKQDRPHPQKALVRSGPCSSGAGSFAGLGTLRVEPYGGVLCVCPVLWYPVAEVCGLGVELASLSLLCSILW